MLLHSSIMGLTFVTSTTERPVVVHPLTDSKVACVKLRPTVVIKGQAEKKHTVTQLSRTITPPSWTVRTTSPPDRKRRQDASPNAPIIMAGMANPQAWELSSGQASKASSGVSINTAHSSRMNPV
jgi:hypothetical protein